MVFISLSLSGCMLLNMKKRMAFDLCCVLYSFFLPFSFCVLLESDSILS